MNRVASFHKYLMSGLEDVMSFYDYERNLEKMGEKGKDTFMRYTFYYDDKPEGFKTILRLDNPKLVHGYIVHLRWSLSPERLEHVRVLKEWANTNGEIVSMDMSINQMMKEELI